MKKTIFAFCLSVALGFIIYSLGSHTVIRHIKLLKDRAAPSEIIIRLGEKIQFDSADGKNHDIAQGEGEEFGKAHIHPEGSKESGPFGPDEGYAVSFPNKGVYHFHDHINPKIYIAVVVY